MPEDNPDESSATDTYGNWSAVGSAFVDRRYHAVESCHHFLYVGAGHFQHADFSEKGRGQCLCINNQFYVLYGVDSGIYHSGSSGLLEV